MGLFSDVEEMDFDRTVESFEFMGAERIAAGGDYPPVTSSVLARELKANTPVSSGDQNSRYGPSP